MKHIFSELQLKSCTHQIGDREYTNHAKTFKALIEKRKELLDYIILLTDVSLHE